MNLQTATVEALPQEPSPSDFGEAMADAMPNVESPPDLDGVHVANDARPASDPANFAALALDAARQHKDLTPGQVATATFSDLPREAVENLAARMWVSEIRRAVGRLRSGRNAPRSRAWDAIGDAHSVGRLDVARWSINGDWVSARDLTLEQVGKLANYYRQQVVAYKTRKERFDALVQAMRVKQAKVAGDLGDELLAALLFGEE